MIGCLGYNYNNFSHMYCVMCLPYSFLVTACICAVVCGWCFIAAAKSALLRRNASTCVTARAEYSTGILNSSDLTPKDSPSLNCSLLDWAVSFRNST